MPEINPLTNNQIFLKKIAENTGSDYETGDVSEINPLTIDQILLKEIAANTDGQSGDISELESKVADNTAAIGAIENVTGAKNSLPYPYVDTSKTDADITYTDIGDGTVTVSGAANAPTGFGISDQNAKKVSDAFPKAGDYIITYKDKDDVFPAGISATIYIQNVYVNVTIPNDGLRVTITDEMMSNSFGMWFAIQSGTAISGTITIKPMIRPAGTDPTYVSYAMTNRELTERKWVDVYAIQNLTTQTYNIPNITNYDELMIAFIFEVAPSTYRKTTISIPVIDIYLNNEDIQYIASIYEKSGDIEFSAFLQFAFTSNTTINIVGVDATGWQPTQYIVKFYGKK